MLCKLMVFEIILCDRNRSHSFVNEYRVKGHEYNARCLRYHTGIYSMIVVDTGHVAISSSMLLEGLADHFYCDQ